MMILCKIGLLRPHDYYLALTSHERLHLKSRRQTNLVIQVTTVRYASTTMNTVVITCCDNRNKTFAYTNRIFE
jgi:hypothetical protein